MFVPCPPAGAMAYLIPAPPAPPRAMDDPPAMAPPLATAASLVRPARALGVS